MANETIAETLERPREHRENRKKNRGRKVQDNQAMAVAKHIRVPPRKARLVMDEVRGKYAVEALAFLRFIPNRAAGFISKVLASAVANAANNHGLNPANLRLVEARVDGGPSLKRMQPRAQGRAYRILKRSSHITVIVQEVEPKPRKPKKAAVTRSRAQVAREAKKIEPPVHGVEKTTIVDTAPVEVEALAASMPEVTIAQETVEEQSPSAETTIETPVSEASDNKSESGS